MKEEIEKAAEIFAETDGYKNEAEKSQKMYDFACGARYVLCKIFEMHLTGNVVFELKTENNLMAHMS